MCEGLYNDTSAVFNPKNHYKVGANPRVPVAGIMSMVDIDISNLRRLWLGNFDTNMPTGTPYYNKTSQKLKGKCDQIPAVACDIPSSNGWVMYLSDRRGDYDFDGKYDMEDVYGPNDGTLQVGEDMQKSAGQLGYGTLQADYGREAEKYRCPNNPCLAGDPQSVSPDKAMVVDHKYYRRGIRLMNGTVVREYTIRRHLLILEDSACLPRTASMLWATITRPALQVFLQPEIHLQPTISLRERLRMFLHR